MRPRFAARIACDGVPMESGNSDDAMWASRVGASAGGATAISGSAAAAAAAHCDQPSVSSTILLGGVELQRRSLISAVRA